MAKVKTDAELVTELRMFHHYEAARRLEQLARGISGFDTAFCPKCGDQLVDPTDYVDDQPAQRVFFDCPGCGFQMAEVVKDKS